MANQIATFFHPYPEEEAVAGIRDHLRAYWTPRVRAAATARADAGDPGLDPLVIKALHVLRYPEALSHHRPTEKTIGGPETVGQLASDAG